MSCLTCLAWHNENVLYWVFQTDQKCIVREREAVVFCPRRPWAAAADRPPAAACVWSLQPIDVEWDQLHKNNSDKGESALRGGPFPRSDRAAPQTLPLQMNTTVAEMSFTTKSGRIFNFKSHTKHSKDGRKREEIKKKVQQEIVYSGCFLGQWHDAFVLGWKLFCENCDFVLFVQFKSV